MNCFIISEASTKFALTALSEENGSPVTATLFNGGEAQHFQVYNNMIVCCFSGKVLDISGEPKEGVKLIVNDPMGSPSQQFNFMPNGNLKNTKFNLCVELHNLSENEQPILRQPSGDSRQKFRVVTRK